MIASLFRFAADRAADRTSDHDSAAWSAARAARASRLARVMLGATLVAAAVSGCSSSGAIAYKTQPPPDFKLSNLNNAASEERIARSALQAGDLEMATTTYTRLLEQDPRSVAGLTGLGDTLYAAGDLTRASVYYDRAVAIEPNSVPALLGRARVNVRLRHFDVAIASYRHVLELQPGHALAQAGLGAALDLSGDHAGAQAFLRGALRQNPGDPGISVNLGVSLIMGGKPREAIEVLTDVTRFPAAPPQAVHDLALAYGMIGNNEAASALLSRDLPKADVDGDLRFYAYARERQRLVASAVPALPPEQAERTNPFGGWGGQSRLTAGAAGVAQ